MLELERTQHQALRLEAGQMLVERFITFAQVSGKSAETYLKALRQMYKYFMLNNITQPTEEDLIEWKAWLQEHEEEGQTVTHKPATIRLYVTAAKLFFSWLEKENLYRNVARYVKNEKPDSEPKKDYLTTAQIRKLLAAVDRSTLAGKRDYAIMVLAITGGLRTIEISRINVEDLTIRGNNSVIYIQGKGCNTKNKFINVPEETETAIREYLQTRGNNDIKMPMFSSISNNNSGGRMSTRAISGMIKGYMKKAGFDSQRITAHSLRHSSVTISLLQGIDVTEVQQFARHRNVNTTMVYAHNIEAENNKCSTRIAEAIF